MEIAIDRLPAHRGHHQTLPSRFSSIQKNHFSPSQSLHLLRSPVTSYNGQDGIDSKSKTALICHAGSERIAIARAFSKVINRIRCWQGQLEPLAENRRMNWGNWEKSVGRGPGGSRSREMQQNLLFFFFVQSLEVDESLGLGGGLGSKGEGEGGGGSARVYLKKLVW